MRYYRIEIEGQDPITSFVGGNTLAGALHVELDIPVTPLGTPSGDSYVKVCGVGLAQIAQAKDLNFKTIKVFGGFQKGLPLAKPSQAGLLVQGYIWQAFGNWQGTEMSLDLLIRTGNPPPSANQRYKPINLSFFWKKGDKMSTAIENALKVAYEGYTITTNISDRLVANEDVQDVQGDIITFSQFVKARSIALINDPKYSGVDLQITEKTITVSDGTVNGNATEKQIKFNDLIGQPTWIQAPSIQFKCPMRSDLRIFDKIKFPKANIINTAAAATSLINQRLTFQGTFQITRMRHVGAYRQGDANSWVTVYDAVAQEVVAA